MIKLFVAALGAAFLLVAPQAHADDQGYLAELTSDGVPMIHGTQGAINGAHTICDELRASGSVTTPFGMMSPWRDQIVAAAQHNFCPDTLH